MAENNDISDWEDVPVDDWEDVPVDENNDDPGGYEGFARKALPVLQFAMSGPERYIAAPTRAAIDATMHKPFGVDAIPAFAKQFGEDPTKAPTSGKILSRLGINTPSVDFDTPFKNYDGNPLKMNTKEIAEGVASAAIDPTMYMAPGVSPIAKGLAKGVGEGSHFAAKKFARIVADIPEEASERYMRNPEAVNKAPLQMQPHVDQWEKMKGDLENQVYQGSASSRQAFGGQRFGRPEIANVFKEVREEIIREAEGVIDPGLQKRLSALEVMENAYAPQPAKAVPTGNLNLDGTPAMRMMQQGPDDVSGNRVKNLVQDLQRNSDFKQSAGDFISVSDVDKNKVMYRLNERLKNNPAYREIMQTVAADMQLLEKAKRIGGTDSSLMGVFRNIGKDAKESQSATIKAVDDRLGTNFHDSLLDTTARRAFENTGTNGSRRTLMGAGAGLPLASLAAYGNNPILAAVIQSIATGTGFAMDKYGGKMAKGAIDSMMFVPRQAKRVAEFAGERLPKNSKYFQRLTEAANQSPKSLILTHHLLMTSDPEYRAYFAD